MASLVSIDDVKVILTTNVGDDDILTFIGIADQFVTNYLSDTDLSDATKKEIERFLTAHLITISRERQTSEEKIGDASVAFSAKGYDKGLNSTTYGQMVKILDSSHTLEKIDKEEPKLYAIEENYDE